MKEEYSVKEVIERDSGKVHRIYTYKRKPCRRIILKSRLCEQLSGYSLIEKDLRSVGVWLSEIDELHSQFPHSKGNALSPDRKTYNIIKGMFVAALTFYGKCFSKCEGRPVKLERTQLKQEYRDEHDTWIKFRHNFAAHSGAARLEYVEIALVLPLKAKDDVLPMLYRELFQPDLALPEPGQFKLAEVVEHARSIALSKIELLTKKIMEEEVLPKGKKYWLNK